VIVAAHQPHFLPWLGYLDKLARADVFVVMDDLQYETQNFQNRQRLKLADGPHWMTVPLARHAQTDRICDLRIDNTGRGGRHHWQHRIWRTLQVHYGRAAWFDRFAPELEDIFLRRWTHLLELDLHVLEVARNWLGIRTPIIRASSLNLRGAKTARIIDFCNKLGAHVYLAGRGGSTGYLDVDALAAASVTPLWQRFHHPHYPQRYSHLGFVSHLGFLDLLLNCGPDSAVILAMAGEAVSEGTQP
jgi:hypothetical protein